MIVEILVRTTQTVTRPKGYPIIVMEEGILQNYKLPEYIKVRITDAESISQIEDWKELYRFTEEFVNDVIDLGGIKEMTYSELEAIGI
jgi:hypothetical protein